MSTIFYNLEEAVQSAVPQPSSFSASFQRTSKKRKRMDGIDIYVESTEVDGHDDISQFRRIRLRTRKFLKRYNQQSQNQNHGLDYDQIGVDFLERPCMCSIQFVMQRSTIADEADISDHASMATCLQQSHIDEHPEKQHPHKTPHPGASNLMKLLDLSQRLPLDGEITPIMAWTMIRGDARFGKLGKGDFEALKEALKPKVRCYGFGAVLEEFEVMDALCSIQIKNDK